jgi:hypothetical protein
MHQTIEAYPHEEQPRTAAYQFPPRGPVSPPLSSPSSVSGLPAGASLGRAASLGRKSCRKGFNRQLASEEALPPKTVHISEDLPRRMSTPGHDILPPEPSEHVAMWPPAPHLTAGRVRTQLPTAMAPRSMSPSTPRIGHSQTGSVAPSPSHSSRDDRDQHMLTSLDELDSRPRRGSLRGSRGLTRTSPPHDTLTDRSAERVGLSHGLGSLGASAEAAGVFEGLGISERRGSMTATSPNILEYGNESSGGAPLFSHSTLISIGLTEGITPPLSLPLSSMPGSSMTSASIESSNVVSAGLAAGLGVNMAAAALAHCLPGGPSGLGSLTEPRFARGSISGPSGTPMDLSAAIGRSLHLTESQLTSSDVVSPVDSLQSDRPNFEDRPMSAQLEADLARRRTTGGLAAGRERTSGRHAAQSSESRAHRRSGTHDPRASAYNPSRPFDSSGSASTRSGIYGTHGSSFAGTSIVEDEHSYVSNGGAGYASVSGSESTSGHSNGAQASGRGSTLADTPSLGNKAMLSPDAQSRGSYLGDGGPGPQLRGYGPAGAARGDEQALGALAIGLAGMSGGGHFGPQVRAKIASVLDTLLAGVPLLESAGETVSIAEYGSLNSRSTPLLPHVISRLAERAHARRPQQAAAPAPSSDDGGYFGATLGAPTVVGSGANDGEPSDVTFSVIHEDSPQTDFRPLMQSLESQSDSYLDSHWQAAHQPSLQNCIFPSFVTRAFATRIAPPNTVHAGFSLMDLHWAHTPRNPEVSLATTAHAELAAFLSARAHEFRPGGVFVMAFIARSDDQSAPPPLAEGSPLSRPPTTPNDAAGMPERSRSRSASSASSPARRPHGDIWTALTNTLAPCIQRLVSCGMLKADVARHMLLLPMHPRTPRQTRAVLKSVRHLWSVEWSCGLGDDSARPTQSQPGSVVNSPSTSVPPVTPRRPSCASSLPSEVAPLRLAHPAWKAYRAGTLPRVIFIEHLLALFKSLYEGHMRLVLKDKGKLSKGACEFVLDSLWDVLSSRLDDQGTSPIDEIELEVTVCALKRL